MFLLVIGLYPLCHTGGTRVNDHMLHNYAMTPEQYLVGPWSRPVGIWGMDQIIAPQTVLKSQKKLQ